MSITATGAYMAATKYNKEVKRKQRALLDPIYTKIKNDAQKGNFNISVGYDELDFDDKKFIQKELISKGFKVTDREDPFNIFGRSVLVISWDHLS